MRGLIAFLVFLALAQEVWSPARYAGGGLPAAPPLVVAGGEVMLDIGVAADGSVGSVRVLRSTPAFTEALTAAVQRWRFTPAAIDKKAVASHVLVAGVFSPPALLGPTLGQPPQDLAAPGQDIPAPVSTAVLQYPPRAQGGGAVLAEVTIDANGASNARIVVSSPGFDGAALASARAWSFRPARREGQPITTRAYLVFVFQEPVTARF